jgi:hypothetical protein
MILSGLAVGLLLAIRIGGLPLLVFTMIAGYGGWILSERSDGRDWVSIAKGNPLLQHFLVLVVGWFVMAVTWPTAIIDPIWNPLNAFFEFSSFSYGIFVQLFGETCRCTDLPWYAFWLEQFLSHPLWCYPFFVIGIWVLIKRWRSADQIGRFDSLVMVFWILPLFLIFVIKPFPVYNGVRHTLFLWPGLAILAGLGAEWIWGVLKDKGRKQLALGIPLLAIVLNAAVLVIYHPFSYTYRNALVYMLPGGINGFDSDYHALSYRLAAEYINDLAEERELTGEETLKVAVLADKNFTQFTYSYFSSDKVSVTFGTEFKGPAYWDEFDYVIGLHAFEKNPVVAEEFGLLRRTVVKRIERMGKIYAIVYE